MTTISKTIRRFMVEFPERVYDVILTKQELEAFKEIKHSCRAEPIRARNVLPLLSSPHKSKILSQLWKKGYVERRQVIAPTGGHEFEYWPVDGLIKEQ